ncbi:uncharacterized protein [Lolium perenne]|uniref:uncharacterized protein n=1 Tax=Lolium perenne TaxID=4522 RepID=UPI003A99E8AF
MQELAQLRPATALKFTVFNIDTLDPADLVAIAGGDTLAVHIPVGVAHAAAMPAILRLIKRLGAKVIVVVDRGCDHTELPFVAHLFQAFKSTVFQPVPGPAGRRAVRRRAPPRVCRYGAEAAGRGEPCSRLPGSRRCRPACSFTSRRSTHMLCHGVLQLYALLRCACNGSDSKLIHFGRSINMYSYTKYY